MRSEIKKAKLEYKRKPNERRATNGIIVHHIYAKKATPQDIHSWHLERGWIGAGYNIYIRKSGDIYQMRGLLDQGAHAKGVNNETLGVALEGNFEEESPTDIQYERLADIINWFRYSYDHDIYVKGHNDVGKTSCPGRNFDWNVLQYYLEGSKNYETLGEVEVVEGEVRGEKAKGYLINNTAYVPLRLIGEELGAEVKWYSDNRTWEVK